MKLFHAFGSFFIASEMSNTMILTVTFRIQKSNSSIIKTMINYVVRP